MDHSCSFSGHGCDDAEFHAPLPMINSPLANIAELSQPYRMAIPLNASLFATNKVDDHDSALSEDHAQMLLSMSGIKTKLDISSDS